MTNSRGRESSVKGAKIILRNSARVECGIDRRIADVRANCMKIGKLVLGPDPLQPAPYGNRTIVSARCLSIIYSRISQSTLLPFRLSRANVLCPFFKRIFLLFFFFLQIEGKNCNRLFVGEKKK